MRVDAASAVCQTTGKGGGEVYFPLARLMKSLWKDNFTDVPGVKTYIKSTHCVHSVLRARPRSPEIGNATAP